VNEIKTKFEHNVDVDVFVKATSMEDPSFGDNIATA